MYTTQAGSFGIATVRGDTVAVSLVVEGGEIRVGATGARALIERRHDLTMPELPPFGGRGVG